MATLDSSRTGAFHAASRALDHAIDAAVEGKPIYPSGTTFVPADLAVTGRLSSYRRLGPVSIVDADGNETRLGQDRFRELAVATVVIGVLIWAISRRTRLPA